MFEKHHTSQDRQKIWREFRNREDLTIETIVDEFQYIKVLDRYLDFYTPSSWPNIFTILYDGYFCQTGITLLMIATLDYRGFIKNDGLILPVISNNDIGNTGVVFQLENNFLNFSPGELTPKEVALEHGTLFQTHKVQKKSIYT